MSKSSSTGFNGIGTADGDFLAVPRIGGDSFSVASVTASTPSVATVKAATGRSEQFVVMRVICTQDCFITEAAAPTAVGDGTMMYLKAGVTELIAFTGANKIAVIRLAVDGVVYFTPVI